MQKFEHTNKYSGIYTYTLTVCDIKKQCDEASVQVINGPKSLVQNTLF